MSKNPNIKKIFDESDKEKKPMTESPELLGLNFIDFDPSSQPTDFLPKMAKRDICKRLEKAINDETQAIMDYKGIAANYFNYLPSDIRKEIIEMSNDETDHRVKFEVLFKTLQC